MSDAPLEPTPMESILGSGAGGPLTAPTPFTVYSGYLGYTGGLVIGTPTGGNEGAGAINASALWANGVQVLPANYLNLSGGTLTGPLILAADPTAALGTSTKQYVDNNITIVNT